MNVLVTGGTGELGRDAVPALRARGHRAVILSRRSPQGEDWRQGDLATGAGLAEAVAGIDVILHAGTAARQPGRLRQTDVQGTRRLLEAASGGGVRHLVYISIVGMESVQAYRYYRVKLAAEAEIKTGGVPWSILRATQFHTLIELFLRLLAPVPGILSVPSGWRFQPVDTRDVAARLAGVVESSPAGLLPDFGGPEERTFRSLAESWRRTRRRRAVLLSLPVPGRVSRALAAGACSVRSTATARSPGSSTWSGSTGLGRLHYPPEMVIGPALQLVLYAFLASLVVRAVFSWIEPYPKNRIHLLAFNITEPVMRPVRQLVPPMGGLDLSFLIVFFVVSFLLNLVQRAG